jgi:hypothetical protein
MGYRIENYNLNELNRIAVPGAVAPSLFWVLPVGNWQPGELDEVWRWFTEGRNQCRDYGLLLVKERGQLASENSVSSLASAAARLRDVMPEGAERFVSPSAFDNESRKLFVLSGGYPQPGWGVLVDWRDNVQFFEGLIRSVSDSLAGDQEFIQGLSVFKKAAASFHDWRDFEHSLPPRPDFTTLEQEIVAADNVDRLLWAGQKELQRHDFRLAGEKFSAATNELRHAAWLELDGEALRSLGNSQKALTAAASLRAVPVDILDAEVVPRLVALIAGSTKPETAFRTSSSAEVKLALKAALYLHERGDAECGIKMWSWAEQYLADEPPRLEASISEVRKEIATKLGQRRGSKTDMEREHERAMESRLVRAPSLRKAFHDSIQRATEVQWDLGPRFLVEFEDICRQRGSWIRTVSWDPARMLGWKIMVRGVNVTVQDLQVAAREFSLPVLADKAGDGEPIGPADGSYFTDYVHFIAISRPGVSPRAVARDLVVRLVRPAEMTKLIALHGGQASENTAAGEMADELLECFGWRKSDETREVPLAACLKEFRNSALAPEERRSGNELRIFVDSFCKDLLDVVVARLGYSEKQVWDAIVERAPEYRPSSRPKEWNDEVGHLSIGAAVILLPALGPLAFPERVTQVSELVTALRTLSDLLNRASHHHEAELSSSLETHEIPVLIHQLLDRAKECLGELPWHMDTSFVYGEQPKIISGEAWSHGSATPRLLRVILWTGSSSNRRVLLWNRTGRNPIITDPMLISRPCRQ